MSDSVGMRSIQIGESVNQIPAGSHLCGTLRHASQKTDYSLNAAYAIIFFHQPVSLFRLQRRSPGSIYFLIESFDTNHSLCLGKNHHECALGIEQFRVSGPCNLSQHRMEDSLRVQLRVSENPINSKSFSSLYNQIKVDILWRRNSRWMPRLTHNPLFRSARSQRFFKGKDERSQLSDVFVPPTEICS